MKQATQTFLLSCAVILMAFIFVGSLTFAKIRPQLTISYLTQTNEAGHYKAFFAITNVGNVTVSSHSSGSVEIFGQDKKETVGCETKLPRLDPGGADIVTVFLPAAVGSRWRFSILYSREGSRGGWSYRGGSSYNQKYATSEWIE